MTPIVNFYLNRGTDHAGRMLKQIQAWPDGRLERVHDFIQWMFPLPEPSPVNSAAPVLDGKTIRTFRQSADLRAALRDSLDRMLRFYGFEWQGDTIVRSQRFAKCAPNWLTRGNHNHLRITRILRSCCLLGLEKEAAAFLAVLRDVYASPDGQGAITPTSFDYWTQAAAAQQGSEQSAQAAMTAPRTERASH